MSEPTEAERLRDLLYNRQMPDNATPRVTLGELRALRDVIEADARASQPLTLDVERLADAMKTYYGKDGGHIVPLGLRDKFGLPDIWSELATGIIAEYERMSRP